MSVFDGIFGAIPGIRRFWWRRKWTSLSVSAEDWAELDAMTEDLSDLLKKVRSLEKLIMDASALRAGHGMNVRSVWNDIRGKERAVDIILDGTAATEKLMEGYHREMDSRRRAMMEIAVRVANWAAKNAVVTAYEDRPTLRMRALALIQGVKRLGAIARELYAATKGRTADEFLHYALLDGDSRSKRLRLKPSAERVRLEKPEPKERSADEKPKTRKKSGYGSRRKIAAVLPETFGQFGIDARFVSFTEAHAVTRYKLRLEKGQKLSKAERISDEVAMSLGVDSVSISKSPDESQIIYIDVPNSDVKPLYFKDAPTEAGKFFIGMSVDGTTVFGDMESLCHILIAGTTGSGKSTFLNALICSVIQNPPSENQFVMIDPKRGVELTPYNGIPHMARPVVTDAGEAVSALEDAAKEMDRRYDLITASGVKKLSEYNEKSESPLPRLIVVIDELADLMTAAGKKAEASVVRIARMGRAAGVHLIVATQRPTVKVITGQIKANIPSRIAFRVASHLESRIILDEGGAEKLAGKGDMLFHPPDGRTVRLQGCYARLKDIQSAIAKAGGE